MIIIVMGPSGSGKSTVGAALAGALGWQFIEADDLHPPENIEKMRSGVGLTRGDRLPWLDAVRREIDQAVGRGTSAVVACSALTDEYRAILSEGLDAVRFVYLRADLDLLADRLRTRPAHFAGPAILPSQLATLEDPGRTALTLDAALPVDVLLTAIRAAWHL